MKFKGQSIQGLLRDQIYWALPDGERDYQNASQIARRYIKDNPDEFKSHRTPRWHVPRAIEHWITKKNDTLRLRRVFTPYVLEEMKHLRVYTGPDGK